MKYKRVVLAIPVFIYGCNDGASITKLQNQQKNTTSINSNTSVQTYKVGGTFDTMSNSPTNTSTCINAAKNESDLTLLNPHASLDFSQSQSLQQVQRALGTDFKIHIDVGVTSIDAAYHYAKSSQDNEYTLNVNYIYQYSGTDTFKNGVLKNGESELTPEARSIVNSSPEAFRKMCGDKYIDALDAGTSVLMRISLRFASSIEKNYFTDNMEKIGDLQNVLDIIRTNPKSVNFTLTSYGIQVGGNPDELNQLFLKNGGYINDSGYPELRCGSSTSINPKCVDLINQVINYASAVQTQLNKPSDYYLTNPVLGSWNSIGISPGEVELNPDIMKAMQTINKLYNQDNDNNNFINNYYQMLSDKKTLSINMDQKMSVLKNKYKQVMKLYQNPDYHIVDCFNGFVSTSCINIKDELINTRSNLLNDKDTNDFLTYLKSNQYLIEIPISTALNDKTDCILSPISNIESGQFMINCDGQISLGESNQPIVIKKSNLYTVSIKNLSFKYLPFNSTVPTTFIYSFNEPLEMDSFYENMYSGDSLLNVIDSNMSRKVTQYFLLTNLIEGIPND